ncbi:hypothetical protein PVAP13_4NG198200 [Panicum virgatum]|uniref:Uncharacterized protein n=1 Tax=Panicum virgatum TaxID=38727 RepID=A0A8T0T638_PANVG|nr:hypothetical protein PVAP13_4NG198200 [Panicum virgatum]
MGRCCLPAKFAEAAMKANLLGSPPILYTSDSPIWRWDVGEQEENFSFYSWQGA